MNIFEVMLVVFRYELSVFIMFPHCTLQYPLDNAAAVLLSGHAALVHLEDINEAQCRKIPYSVEIQKKMYQIPT